MKFTCESKAFAAALAPAVKIISKRSTTPILSNVLIEAVEGMVTVTGDSLDVRVATPCVASVTTPGAITLPGHILNDLVRRLPAGGDLALEMDAAERAILRAGRTRAALPVLPATDFPQVGTAAWTHAFALPAGETANALARTAYAISTEEARYYLNGTYVHVHDAGEGPRLRFVATDGHRLGCAELPLPDHAADMPPVLIPRETVLEVAKLLGTGTVDVAVSSGLIRFRFPTGTEFVSKLIDGTFPDYLRAIPAGHDKDVVVDTAALGEAIERIAVVAEKSRGTKFAFADGALTITVENEGREVREDVEIDGDAALTIGFNAAYVRETLAALACDAVRIELGESGSPAQPVVVSTGGRAPTRAGTRRPPPRRRRAQRYAGMIQPVRLQLSRRAGFNLQALSVATNGLPAVNVSRPGRWGNPFVIGEPVDRKQAKRWGWWPLGKPDFVAPDATVAVRRFAACLCKDEAIDQHVADSLRDRNLACWCAAGAPCDADVLLELANQPIVER